MRGELRVIKHLFLPSGSTIWTAVGEDEYLLSLDPPLCTCPDFAFSVARGRPRPCKHLRALLRAIYWGEYTLVLGSDEELWTLLMGELGFYTSHPDGGRAPVA